MSIDNSLDRLLTSHGGPVTNGLNARFRKALKEFAVSQKLQYSQDNIGNIYITRPGRDHELSSICLTFPLDEPDEHLAFSGAFQAFSHFESHGLKTDLTLLGWTSTDGKLGGRDFWDTFVFKKEPVGQQVAHLQQFEGLPDPSNFSSSAMIEIQEYTGRDLTVSGSPVLVTRVKKLAPDHCKIGSSSRKASRAPEILIQGEGAEDLAQRLIRDYSDYIAALFENFD
ncbi:hypothetical protein A1O1_06672 [Capronia coronata CBS 617.96]|uniref:Uncharacterized protein n=1 Tax=Capronia coronata CBS 617.96 TaxID=1182541 RepID=W9YLA4_9EURO|nr:uncharacterized protein A1O1_06672 [Capronia coronata CBS 617.96]EXJ83054.1 hypothetical protein A1O1_06672 [Capronia coronata CBS 617.96]